jgi:hypothetical protein
VLVNNKYKTVEGLVVNGCDQKSAENIVMLVQKIDECFEEHNKRCEENEEMQRGRKVL